jgi:hypothetical protein
VAGRWESEWESGREPEQPELGLAQPVQEPELPEPAQPVQEPAQPVPGPERRELGLAQPVQEPELPEPAQPVQEPEPQEPEPEPQEREPGQQAPAPAQQPERELRARPVRASRGRRLGGLVRAGQRPSAAY